MADLVGGAILNVLFDRLSSPEVVNWIKGKKLDQKLIGRLKTTLYAVQALLTDAENRQIKERAVKDWLDSLKDAVYMADDLLDEVATKAATQKDAGNFFSRFLNSPKDREMVNRMEGIIDTLESIVNQKDTVGLKEIPKENLPWRITSSLAKVSDIHGRDKDKEAIIKLLLDDTTGDEISVIPIVGMGGIGKTTLAQLVYHDDEVKQKFDFLAWVCVSEEFDVIKVTKTILEAMTRVTCTMKDLNLLQRDLEERLSRKKFLVVLDDAWNENYDDWNMLLEPFRTRPVKGSKILLTTRSKNVASVVQTVSPYELSLLSPEDCWSVFAKHAVLSTDQSVKNSALEKIGRDIVKKCDGLPLAAQSLGGLLRGNYDVRHWSRILKSEIWEFSDEKSRIIPALRISYYYLPSYLKECFVYCSLYPQDYRFDKDELILLWMAEDFLRPMGEKTFEDVGDEYFDELVSRSFFQPYNTSELVPPSFFQPYSTSVDSFVMHDLMHDLATFCAGEFYFRAEKEVTNANKIDNKTRHLSHNAKGDCPISEILDVCDRIKHTRTFLEINLDKWIPFNMENAPCILLSQLKCLRVLTFEGFPLDSLPDSIGELIHLRYLNLSRTLIVILPESLTKLYNLQTLKLNYCLKLKLLPSDMQNLVNLRHLDIRCTSLEEMPKGMSKLKSLQVLSDFFVGKHEENGISELGGLENLHGSLIIANLHNVLDADQASKAIMGDKKHISHLSLRWSSEGDIADSQIESDILDELRPYIDLKELKIIGYRGTKFPNWLGKPCYHNMTSLKLYGCENCCMLPSLGQLPSLLSLSIYSLPGLEVIGTEFYENDESCLQIPFPSLESLSFYNMPCWKEWQEWHSLEFHAFPKLKNLFIVNCPVLTGELPSQLPALETLQIRNCNQLSCSLPRAPAIQELQIVGDNRVRMGEPPLSLHRLMIAGSHLVEAVLASITHTQLSCLQELEIWDCSSAISFPVASLPASLHSLTIRNCRKLEFQLHQQHESLQKLHIYQCDSLTSFSLDAFPNLTNLTFSRCENMKSLVVSQSKIKGLTIWDCQGIDLFPEGDPPPNLRDLCIGHCEKQLSFLAWMNSHSHTLTNLEIRGEYDRVTSFPKEGLLPASLESLKLSNIPSLETLDCNGLVHLTSIRELTIENCPKLENVTGERLPHSLTRLFIYTSPLLGKRCEMKDPQIWPKISHIRGIRVDYGTWIL